MNTEHTNQSTAPEPFGYFKAEPFGWTDCADGDEGAVALYEQSTVIALCQQLELERGSLFAENQRKQQLQGQVDALLAGLAKISRMTMSMYANAGEAMRDAKRIAHEAIAAAEQSQQFSDETRVGWTSLGTIKSMLPDLLASDDARVRENAQIIDALVKMACAGMAQHGDHIVDATKMVQAEPVAYMTYKGRLLHAADPKVKEHSDPTPLYENPPVARDVLMALAEEVRETCWQVGSGDATIRELDLAAIVDRYAAQPPAVAVPGGWLPSGDGQIPSEMSAAGARRLHKLLGVSVGFYEADEAFRAMLAAAPQAAVSDGCPKNFKKLSEWLEHENAVLRQKAVAAPQAAGESSVRWPQERDVGRIGDMSHVASLRVGLDADNDVYVSIANEEGMADVEFCVPGNGGGKSPCTRAALIALMAAMEADNAETPSRDWWKAREGDAQKGGA